MPRIPPETVQRLDHDRVAGPRIGEQLIKPGARGFTSRDPVVLKNAVATRFLQSVDLSAQILISA
jgi:hypothetical protein